MGHPMENLFSIQGKYVLFLDKELRPVPSDEIRRIPSMWAVTAIEEEDGVKLWFIPAGTRLICRMVLKEGAVVETGTAQDKKRAAKRRISDAQVEIISQVPEDARGWLITSRL